MSDIQISAPAGSLQVRAVWQESEQVVLICHPHPLFGGTMDNKVVTTLARFFKSQHISVVTFNFRGVGSSTGTHDNGVGEIDDALSVLSWILRQHPSGKNVRQLYIAGFSFGAYIAAAVASRIKSGEVIAELKAYTLLKTYLVAPPVHHYPMQTLNLAKDTSVLIGDEDEVVPHQLVIDWALSLDLPLALMPQCSHFFHGHLTDLTQQLQQNFP